MVSNKEVAEGVEDIDVSLRGVTKVLGGRRPAEAPGAAGESGRRAVDGVTLDVRRGEFFSLLGPSGCGKTTLLRLIAGFETPDAGSIHLAGRDVTRVPPHRRDVNMVFQNYALFPHLTVAENVAFGLRIARDPRAAERAREALARVGLAGAGDRPVAGLSGGEQQRVALARAIVTRPRVLLLDEPLSALDLKLRTGLREELRRLQRELGMTFLHVTHDQGEALALSDRVGVMNAGRLEQVGTPEEIYERPATRFVAEFVGSGNFFEGTGDGRVVRTRDGLTIEAPARGEVTLLVRPEKIRIPGGTDGIPARVEEVLYQGSSASIILRAGARRIVAEDANDGTLAQVRPGETITVSWRPEDVLVLPRE
jgi:ABC-type Fe3+/spermidine/putrescine transport system ATPase subunit